jgi:hypothetical protein
MVQNLQRPLNFQPRLEGKCNDTNFDYAMESSLFADALNPDSLPDWLSILDQEDMTLI